MKDEKFQSVLEIQGVPASLPMSYRQWSPVKPNHVGIFLHGFADHGGSFIRRLYPKGWPKELAETGFLAPNGLFPVPTRTEDGWREAYSWYFFDEKKSRMLIPPDFAIEGIERLIESHQLQLVPKTVIGFSQGGFLAPLLVEKIQNVCQIVAVGSGFRTDFYRPLLGRQIRINAIHGADDPIFPVASAETAHKNVLELGFQGEFFPVPKIGHTATSEIGVVITQLMNRFSIGT